jgi:2-methylisocitrate lyase-like PEP mutase family enzyme
MTSDLAARAERLLSLHVAGDPVVLPTVWDAWSARVAADQGFLGLTVGSHPAAAAVGRGDGEDLSLDEMLSLVAVVTRAVDLPVSADLESGYGAAPDELVDGLLGAGAVGLNLEDTVHGEGGRLRTTEEHAALIAGVRGAADSRGVHVVVNGRTDILMNEVGPAEDRLARAIERLGALAAAGADSLYPVGFHDDATWQRLTAELPRPLNALARPGKDDLVRFRELRVGRISFGPRLQRDTEVGMTSLLGAWTPGR